MAKIDSLIGPTRASVEKLLRELRPDRCAPESSDYYKLNLQIDELEGELMNDPVLKKLRAARDKAEKQWDKEYKQIVKRLDNVRRRFYANGATPEVIAELNALVDEFNRE